MAPVNPPNLLSPAELAYLHSSLSLTPPIRPDSRSSSQFRPLVAETDILPGTNGSARVCFADGTEAVVGVKAEVERTGLGSLAIGAGRGGSGDGGMGDGEGKGKGGVGDGRGVGGDAKSGRGEDGWVEVTIEIPGFRDDDPLPVFLASMLAEALLAAGDLPGGLYINARWHWRLYVDLLLLSPPLSYPLPLLSLTTHLALLSTRLPALKSEGLEDPLFDDDWDAALPLYPRAGGAEGYVSRPPVTLLVMAVGQNIIFDPTREELAVAEAVLAVSLAGEGVGERGKAATSPGTGQERSGLRLLAIRTVDPPSRLTTRGVPDAENSATGGGVGGGQGGVGGQGGIGGRGEKGVWYPPKGGMKRELIGRVLEMCLKRGGVGEEVLAGLEAVEVG